MIKPFSLSKNERLKSKKQIDALFLQGEAFFVFPYKIKYLIQPESELPALQFGISVPKKSFKKAVHRNKLKRLSREAYRQKKTALQELLNIQKKSLIVMFTYAHHEILKYREIEPAVQKCLTKLMACIQQ